MGIGLYARQRLQQKKGRLAKVLTNSPPSIMPFMGDVATSSCRSFRQERWTGKAKSKH